MPTGNRHLEISHKGLPDGRWEADVRSLLHVGRRIMTRFSGRGLVQGAGKDGTVEISEQHPRSGTFRKSRAPKNAGCTMPAIGISDDEAFSRRQRPV